MRTSKLGAGTTLRKARVRPKPRLTLRLGGELGSVPVATPDSGLGSCGLGEGGGGSEATTQDYVSGLGLGLG